MPLRPRFNRLVVGPSGTGKTHLARQLASKLGTPYLELCVTNWIPMGANDRGARPTWLDIAGFCHANHRGVICLDELDKSGCNSPWMTYLRVEIFSLLDKRFPANLHWKPGDDDEFEADEGKCRTAIEERLSNAILVIGAGAFQDLWQAHREPAGFHAGTAKPAKIISHRAMAEVIPVEILNRFVPPVIAIPPLEKGDYLAIFDSLRRRFPKARRTRLRELARSSLDEAIEDQLGARWAEKLVLELATRDHHRPEPKSRAAAVRKRAQASQPAEQGKSAPDPAQHS